MSDHDRLIDHALVMNHVQRHVIGHRDERLSLRQLLERSGAEQDLVDQADESVVMVGAGEPIVATGAPHHVGRGRFIEVAWPCGCGLALHADPERVLRTWARHVERECGIDADHLEQHCLAEVRGFTPTAYCSCGDAFTVSPEATDPFDPAHVLAKWEAHVRGANR